MAGLGLRTHNRHGSPSRFASEPALSCLAQRSQLTIGTALMLVADSSFGYCDMPLPSSNGVPVLVDPEWSHWPLEIWMY